MQANPTAPDFTHTPIKRAAALAQGLKFFFTGRPCGHGHVSRRYVSTGTCVQCQRAHSLDHQKIFRTGRALKGQNVPFIIVRADSAEALATIVETVKILGGRIVEQHRGPAEIARSMRVAPPEWTPPPELVAPVLAQTTPVQLPRAYGEDWQRTNDDRAGEVIDEHPQHVVLRNEDVPRPPVPSVLYVERKA